MDVRGPGRAAAIVTGIAALAIAALIVTMAAGMFEEPLLDIVSLSSAALGLVAVVLAYGAVTPGTWMRVGRAVTVAGMSLVLAGDALQSAVFGGAANADGLWAATYALRDVIGNGLFFASLIVLGALMWRRQSLLAGLAIANGVLGYLDLAFASRLGLPPHVNFIVLVIWLVGLAISWWRNGVVPTERLASAMA